MIPKKDKRGIWGMILMFLILFTIVIAGFIAVLAMGVIDYASDTITPIMEEVGNNPDISNYSGSGFNNTFGNVDTVVQSFPWVIAFSYVMALIFVIAFVVIYRENPHPVFIAFYLMMVILLIFGCIIISNIYQELYDSNDMIGTSLHEQALMSYMMLYSPFIMAVIALIGGVFMFTGGSNDGL